MQATLSTAFSILVCLVAAPSSSASAPQPAKPDWICHTKNPKDCYPRIFRPTNQFQVVHNDQELPNGLHVRLNIWTGQKEAKINVPGETDASLEGLPVDRAVVMVDPAEPEGGLPSIPSIPRGAPEYEPVGKVRQPQQESGTFGEGLKMLKKGAGRSSHAFDDALEGLEELSHDLYYGLKIAEDPKAVKALLCLMSSHQAGASPAAVPRDQQAAAILAGALQNNPTALSEVAKAWPRMAGSKCPATGESLRRGLYLSVMPSRNGGGGPDAERAVARVKSKVAVMNGLVKDSAIRAEFLKHGGMASLLRVLMEQDRSWAPAQRKVGQLVQDSFLDEDMGAILGQWPKGAQLSDKQCKTEDAQAAEGCWDYHVDRIVKLTKAKRGDWSWDLRDRLAGARKQQREADEPKEL
ncbi:uncharacterized protein UV8b_02415 [Ustilaginoidea virens]|uniref:Uncharacterized protein n=1 Tax=Ustilaginoidea virens TaxID=1159556 RepID=A0A063BUC9_USTVR|nr:uncharacterized protein UV8b_02415 [Ustilaginoidea virens]QUC18174.1 hypothetical protein UV8b_02415 [Ustilaginoidea virens]GAO15905.1 hypothetical protein UVI_02039300 [Ustilaginoidea virens]